MMSIFSWRHYFFLSLFLDSLPQTLWPLEGCLWTSGGWCRVWKGNEQESISQSLSSRAEKPKCFLANKWWSSPGLCSSNAGSTTKVCVSLPFIHTLWLECGFRLMYSWYYNYQMSKPKDSNLKRHLVQWFWGRRGKCSKQLPESVTSYFNQNSPLY